jgi:hypothetical protein
LAIGTQGRVEDALIMCWDINNFIQGRVCPDC